MQNNKKLSTLNWLFLMVYYLPLVILAVILGLSIPLLCLLWVLNPTGTIMFINGCAEYLLGKAKEIEEVKLRMSK